MEVSWESDWNIGYGQQAVFQNPVKTRSNGRNKSVFLPLRRLGSDLPLCLVRKAGCAYDVCRAFGQWFQRAWGRPALHWKTGCVGLYIFRSNSPAGIPLH